MYCVNNNIIICVLSPVMQSVLFTAYVSSKLYSKIINESSDSSIILYDDVRDYTVNVVS